MLLGKIDDTLHCTVFEVRIEPSWLPTHRLNKIVTNN
jgi:hypothetical protein